MTSALQTEPPVITCVSSLIASCPPLVGFDPTGSLVALAALPDGSTMIARVDIVADEHAAECAQVLAGNLIRAGCVRAHLVLWLDIPDTARASDLPGVRLVRELVPHLDAGQGVALQSVVATNGTTWWNLHCENARCCDEGARPVDAEIAEDTRLRYILAGYATLGGREDVGSRLETHPVRTRETARELAGLPARSRSLGARRRSVDALWRSLAPGRGGLTPVGPGCVASGDDHPELRLDPWTGPGPRGARILSRAQALRELSDSGVRDAVLVRLARATTRCRSCWERPLQGAIELLRAAPPGHVAPAATLVSIASWLNGNGVLAVLAAERALEDQPDYRLAILIHQMVTGGVPPQAWRTSFESLSEDQCLAATSPRRQRGVRS